jgi:hypothetical protein
VVECDLAKVDVASSNLVSRSTMTPGRLPGVAVFGLTIAPVRVALLAFLVAGSTGCALIDAIGESAGGYGEPRPIGGFPTSAVSVIAADLDGNGQLDVAASFQTGLTVLIGGPVGGDPSMFAQANIYNDATGGGPMVVADFDGDGARNDLAVVRSAEIVIIRNAGSGGPFVLEPIATGFTATKLEVGSLGGTAADDLVAFDPTGSAVHIYQNLDTTLVGTNIPVTINFSALATGQFSGEGHDGVEEVVIADGETLQVYSGDGMIASTTHVATLPGGLIGSIAVGEFDGEYTRDDLALAWACSDCPNQIRRVSSQAQGFVVDIGPPAAEGFVAIDLLAANLDQDGQDDDLVARTDGQGQELGVLMGTSTGFDLQTYGIGGQPADVAAGDFDRDGRADLVVGLTNAGQQNVILMLSGE